MRPPPLPLVTERDTVLAGVKLGTCGGGGGDGGGSKIHQFQVSTESGDSQPSRGISG